MADAFFRQRHAVAHTVPGRAGRRRLRRDEEGVRAKDVTLVNKGRLVTLAQQPESAEEFSGNRTATAEGPVHRRVYFSFESALGDSRRRAEEQIPRPPQAQDKNLRLTSCGASARRRANAGPGIRSGCEVDARRQRRAGSGLRSGDVPSTAFKIFQRRRRSARSTAIAPGWARLSRSLHRA